MIVLDTSALVAIIQAEPECDTFLNVIRTAERVVVSAVSVLEAGMVLYARKGETGIDETTNLLDGMGVEIVPFDAALVQGALQAFVRYGKGNNSPARLNFGDCAVYALAKSMNAPLLFKGNDFSETDISAAWRPVAP